MARTATDPTSAYTEANNEHKQLGKIDSLLHYPKGYIEALNNYSLYKNDTGAIVYGLAIQHHYQRITNTQLLNLNSSPVDLLSALGATKVILPIFAYWKYNYDTADFVMVNDLNIIYDGGATLMGCSPNLIKWGADALYKTNATHTDGVISAMLNKKLVLTADTDPTTGGGTIDIDIVYQVLEAVD